MAVIPDQVKPHLDAKDHKQRELQTHPDREQVFFHSWLIGLSPSVLYSTLLKQMSLTQNLRTISSLYPSQTWHFWAVILQQMPLKSGSFMFYVFSVDLNHMHYVTQELWKIYILIETKWYQKEFENLLSFSTCAELMTLQRRLEFWQMLVTGDHIINRSVQRGNRWLLHGCDYYNY